MLVTCKYFGLMILILMFLVSGFGFRVYGFDRICLFVVCDLVLWHVCFGVIWVLVWPVLTLVVGG